MSNPTKLPKWKQVWREGFLPSLSVAGLYALGVALRDDDARLLQGATTSPPPISAVLTWTCEGADAVGFALIHESSTLGESTVGKIEDLFAEATCVADRRMGDAGACRHFLNWYDETPRVEMRKELLEEVTSGLLLCDGVAEAARLWCPLKTDTPLDIMADWLEDHDRIDVVGPLRKMLNPSSEIA